MKFRLGALLIALALAIAPALAQQKRVAPGPMPIAVSAHPIEVFDNRDPGMRRFGALEFRGGLVLTSGAKDFGGISAINVGPDGAFTALTDKAYWLKGRITYDGTRPSGIVDAQMAPMLGPDGRPLAERGWYDTESLAIDGDVAYAGIERVNRIVRFNLGQGGLRARGQPVEMPPELRNLPNNLGLEAMALVPAPHPMAGTLIAMSERSLDAKGNITAAMIGGPTPGAFTIKRSADYDISDAAPLPNGDLLILERKFSWVSGVAIRIRRLPIAELKPGALLDGPALFEADFAYQIDNMEGISVHKAPSGETVLTLVSDDNFSMIQRTLLLQFTLRE